MPGFIAGAAGVSSFLSAMDIFVFPSLFEGLPLTVIEAECSGLDVFISDTVTSEVILTDNTIQLNLSLSDIEWASRIIEDLKYNKINRTDAWKVIKEKGYDIKDASDEVAKLLLTDKR